MLRNFFILFSFWVLLVSADSSKHKCSSNPADWCKSLPDAQACQVVDSCSKFVWSQKIETKNEQLVNFTLYFETLCPDSKHFIITQLWPTFQSVGAIMNLTIVPYGNAKETWRNETKLWQFTCQHGADECWANLLQTCLINFYPKSQDHFPFVYCMESDTVDDIRTSADKCGKEFNIPMEKIYQCMNSRTGNNLEHQMALKTDALNPPLQFVPWVTLNGAHTDEIQNRAETDLIGLICDTYKGTKPAACSGLLTKRACPRSF